MALTNCGLSLKMASAFSKIVTLHLMKVYPFDSSFRHHFFLAIGFGIWVFVFLFATKPLDVSELNTREQLLFLPVYSLIAGLAYLAVYPLQMLLFKWWSSQWTLLHELIFGFNMLSFGLICAWNYYFFGVMDSNPNSYTFGYFTSAIYLPAVFTIIPPLFIGRYALGKYREKKNKNDFIEILGVGNFEGIRLSWADLICVQSADNYVEVFFQEGDGLKRQLIRNKLVSVEEDCPRLVRTHRSYLINPTHFVQWKKGNRKLSLLMSKGIEVPVSKNYQSEIEKAVNLATEM